MSVSTLSAFVTPTGNHMVVPLRPAKPNPPEPAEATPVSPTRQIPLSTLLAAVTAGAVLALAVLGYVITSGTTTGPARALLTLAAFVGLFGGITLAVSAWSTRRVIRHVDELVPHLARVAALAEQSAARQAELAERIGELERRHLVNGRAKPGLDGEVITLARRISDRLSNGGPPVTPG